MIGVTVRGTFIACEIESELQFDKEMIPVSSTASGKWTEYIPGKRTWQMTVNMGLLKRAAGEDFKTLYMAYFDDVPITVQFRTRPTQDQQLIFEGEGYVKSGTSSAPRQGLATANMVIQGSGVLNMEWEEFWQIINAMPAEADKPLIVDTTDW